MKRSGSIKRHKRINTVSPKKRAAAKTAKRNPRIGSTLGSFLREEGIADAVAKRAVEKIVHSTTTKTPAAPHSKASWFECEALRAYVWRKGCYTCGAGNPDVHHVRTRGAGHDDLANVVGLCRECHTKLHSGTLVGAETLPARARELLESFIRNATTAERHSFMAAWEAFAAGRAWQEMVTW